MEETAFLPENWQESEDLFAAQPDGPLDPPGGPGTGVRETADFAAAVEALKRLYPDFTHMPDEVAAAVSAGEEVKDAYSAWRIRQAEAENEKLRRAAAAPVRGVKNTAKEGGDPFLMGFDHDKW